MSMDPQFSTLDMDCETTIAHLTRRLSYHGLWTIRDFDLQSACASFTDLSCPHNGDSTCGCQMVVLLVFSNEASPASIVLHTHHGKTDVDLIDSPNNYPGQQLKRTIQHAFEKIEDSLLLLNWETNAI